MENTEVVIQSTESTELVESSSPETLEESGNTEVEDGENNVQSTEVIENVEDGLGETVPEAPGTDESSKELSSYVISYEEIELAVKNAMMDYYSSNTVQVVDAGDAPGINKSLDELSLTETCLVIIVLILLGRSILHIIGGRAWNK